MDKALIENWNSVVKQSDLVIHMGDFAFTRNHDPNQYLKHLQGTIILIAGNHDSSRTRKRMPFCCNQMIANIGPYRCLLNHRPIYPVGSDDPFKDSANEISVDGFDFVISGHIHQLRIFSGISLNVGVDVTNFLPITQERVLELLNERSKTPGFRNPVHTDPKVLATMGGGRYAEFVPALATPIKEPTDADKT